MREEISIAHRILPSRLASRDALREGKTSCLASRDALRERKTSRLASRDARREGKTSRLASRDVRREGKTSRLASRDARREEKNIAPRIARCEARGKKHRAIARCFFIGKRARIFTAGVILLTNPLRANDHMANISHFSA